MVNPVVWAWHTLFGCDWLSRKVVELPKSEGHMLFVCPCGRSVFK